MAHRKVLMVVAHEGYQQIEYQIPKKALTQAGFTVVTASNKPGIATAKDKSTTKVDLTVEQAIAGDYDALIFVGGPGTLDNLDNQIRKMSRQRDGTVTTSWRKSMTNTA